MIIIKKRRTLAEVCPLINDLDFVVSNIDVISLKFLLYFIDCLLN